MSSNLRSRILTVVFSFFLLALASCSKDVEPRTARGTLDTPSYHVMRGKDLLDQQRPEAAAKQFDLALELQSDYPPALAGKALTRALDSQRSGQSADQVDAALEESAELLDQALSKASTPEEKVNVRLLALRTVTITAEGEDWIEDAQNHFEVALELYEEHPELRGSPAEPWYYLGHAQEKALQFEEAQASFRKVLDLNRGFTREANLALEQLDKVVRAQPGTRHGQEIALTKQITRADMAALLMQELRLADLYQRNASDQRQQLSYESPTKEFVPPGESVKERPLATDISDHPLQEDIATILRLGVRGLEANPQYLFFPDKQISRAEYALMLEDVLIQVTQDQNQSTRFVGDTSPFVDVRPDAYYYNAARTLVSRNIMQLQDKVRGEFGPDRAVAGADALLGLRLLKDELQRYVRSPSS